MTTQYPVPTLPPLTQVVLTDARTGERVLYPSIHTTNNKEKKQ
jgi:hypothetical protein